MKTFGFAGSLTPRGLYGLGDVAGAPLQSGVVTTRFNVIDAYHSTPHSGVDIAGPAGSEIIAPADGIVAANYTLVWPGPGVLVLFPGTAYEKVIQPGEPDRRGNTLVLIHEGPWRLLDGSTALRAATLYCHLAGLPPLPVTTRVKAGDVIGHQGTTGYSTGPHLHWALAFQRDPMGWFPPTFGDASELDDPLPYIGVPVTDVTPAPPVSGIPPSVTPPPITLPSGGFDIGVVASLWQYVVAGGQMADVDVDEVPATRDGWSAWHVERKDR